MRIHFEHRDLSIRIFSASMPEALVIEFEAEASVKLTRDVYDTDEKALESLADFCNNRNSTEQAVLPGSRNAGVEITFRDKQDSICTGIGDR